MCVRSVIQCTKQLSGMCITSARITVCLCRFALRCVTAQRLFVFTPIDFDVSHFTCLFVKGHKAVTGRDSTGSYSGTVFSYMAGKNKLQAQILVYNEGEFVRFTQVRFYET